jgi:hypothetical protein
MFMQQLSFFVLWERDPNDPNRQDGEFSVRIDDVQLSNVRMSVDFENGRRHRSIVSLNGLVVPRPGNLTFRINLQDGASAEYSIAIATPPPAVRAADPGRVIVPS